MSPPPEITRLGRYQIVRRLALGGMAELFLARAAGVQGFEKQVVIKRVLPQLATEPEFVDMFLDEARLAAGLHHPNIAQVFDIGREGGSYFFAMEYVPGRDLHQILRALRGRGERLSPEHAVAIALAVCAGLHHAHEATDAGGRPLGIVHRDVSPSNVVVTFDGAVKLLDFGIAEAASHRAVTRAGLLKGKMAYMSPEQCKGAAVDRRSDVFCVGILLYEMTTGTPLYAGDSDYAILHQIADMDAPRPSSRRPDYPPELEAIVLRALARNPARRYRTAEELQLDLENYAREHKLVLSPIELGRTMRELFEDGDRMEGSPGLGTAPAAAESRAPLWQRAPEGLAPVLVGGDDTHRPGAGAAAPRRRFLLAAALGGAGLVAAGAAWLRRRNTPPRTAPAPASVTAGTPASPPTAGAPASAPVTTVAPASPPRAGGNPSPAPPGAGPDDAGTGAAPRARRTPAPGAQPRPVRQAPAGRREKRPRAPGATTTGKAPARPDREMDLDAPFPPF